MRHGLLAGTGTVCAALLVLGGATTASAADQDAATGVTASIIAGKVAVTWTHSPQALTGQWVNLSDTAVGSGRGGDWQSTVDPAANAATVDIPATDDLVGGHTYAVSVVSSFQNSSASREDVASDAVQVTLPEHVPDTPESRPRCSVRQSTRVLTIAVPVADVEDTAGRHTVTSRTIEILQNGKPYATRTLAGATSGSVALTVPYLRATASSSTAWYTARYAIETSAGTSRPSESCAAGLATPRPHEFALKGVLRDGVANVTWAKAKDPVSPITKYKVTWQLGDGRTHVKTVQPSDRRSFSVRIGATNRVRLDVYAYNALNTWTWNGELWNKYRGMWSQGGGR